jgi:hypothetical protein
MHISALHQIHNATFTSVINPVVMVRLPMHDCCYSLMAGACRSDAAEHGKRPKGLLPWAL